MTLSGFWYRGRFTSPATVDIVGLTRTLWSPLCPRQQSERKMPFLVAQGAIADNVEEKLAEAGKEMLHEEGHREGEWILLDFGDVVVHVFRQDAREFYALEQLWADAKLETYED